MPLNQGAGAVTPEYEVPSLTHNLGTKLYMSPELESNKFYDYKVRASLFTCFSIHRLA